MKITDWRRKLSAAVLAGGLLVPCATSAAPLGANLVVNPGFEDVNPAVTCCYSATKVNAWADGTQSGFAYNYGQLYDNGGPLAGGGTYYFTPNAESTGTDITTPAQVAQLIDLSTGPTAAAIATGQARFQLSAFFTSYADDADIGNVQLDFLNASLSPLPIPPVVISDNNPATWTQVSTSGLIPVATFAARISLYGTPVTFGPDGYIDNVDFRVVPEPAGVALAGIGLMVAGLSCARRRKHDELTAHFALVY